MVGKNKMVSNKSVVSGKYSNLAFLFVFPLHYSKKSLTKSVTHLESRSKGERWVINSTKTKDRIVRMAQRNMNFAFTLYFLLYKNCT